MLKNLFSKSKKICSEETISILRLIRSENVGIKTFYNLITFYGSAKVAIENLPDFMSKIGRSKFHLCSFEELEPELAKMEKIGAKYVSYNESEYPILLRHIHNAPPIFSYKGDISLASGKCAAIVGARNCSISGKQMTSKISKELSYAKINIISGLARGIDTEAHLASLPNTIAVIAGGIGNIYPPENHKLYSKIEAEGLLIAELPVGAAPLAKHFPQRNRIISGIAECVIVIEASMNSGSLITAKFALEQNREIFACPGFPMDPRHRGTNKLIKDGANLLESSEEIIEFFNNNTQLSLNDDKSLIREGSALYLKIDENLVNQENKELILESISSVPCSIEEILNYTQLPLSVVASILLELELTEKIVYQPGNRILLNFTNI